MWLLMAFGSAFFAGLTTIFAKCGIKNTDSDLATALRTIVVLGFSWLMVLLVGSAAGLREISLPTLVFLLLSGLATGASWLCYFKALALGNVNKVAAVDKLSTVLTILLAIALFQETAKLPFKLAAVAMLGLGILFMLERKPAGPAASGQGWLVYALLSAVFAALTTILAKIGLAEVESNLGTAIRTTVVLLLAWLIVLQRGKQSQIKNIRPWELLFIALSGVATGASWLCYYYAIQNGVVSVVVPVDKLSIVVTVAFSYIVFKEKLSRRALFGLALLVFGTLLMTLCG